MKHILKIQFDEPHELHICFNDRHPIKLNVIHKKYIICISKKFVDIRKNNIFSFCEDMNLRQYMKLIISLRPHLNFIIKYCD